MSATVTDKVRTTEASNHHRFFFTYYTTVDEGGDAGEHSTAVKESRVQDIQSESTTRYSKQDTIKVFKARQTGYLARDARRGRYTR